MPELTKTAVRNSATIYTGTKIYPDKPEPIPNPGYFQALRQGRALPIGSWSREFWESESEGSSFFDASYDYVTPYAASSFSKDDSVSGDIHWPGYDYYLAAPKLRNDVLAMYFSLQALKTEAVNRAKNSAWDIGTFAAEADKTYDLVRNAHTRTFQRAHSIIGRYGGRWGRGAAAAAAFASAWMEYRYGWRILMYDLESAQDSVFRLREHAKHLVERGTAFERQEKVRSRVTSGTSTWMPSHALNSSVKGFVANHTHNVANTRIRLDHRVGAGVESSLAWAFTINPLLTAWELVPFSFIVDWFVDVGGTIGASSPTLGRNLKYVWYSKREEIETTMITSWAPRTDLHPFYRTRGNSGYRQTTLRSVRYERIPTSYEAWNLSFNPRLDLGKFTDLVALTIGMESGVKRRLR